MNEIWDEGHSDYMAMVRRHKPLWDFLERFCKEFHVKSLLDVGGGDGHASFLAKDYMLVDVNVKAVEWAKSKGLVVFNGNFLDIEPALLTKKPDLVLIAGLAEHYGDYVHLILKTEALKPKYCIMTFFKGLDRDEDMIVPLQSFKGRFYKLCLFCKKRLKKELKRIGLYDKSILFKLMKLDGVVYSKRTILDDVLVINFSKDKNFKKRLKRCLNEK